MIDETRIRVTPETLEKLNRLESELYGSEAEISHDAFLNQLMEHFGDSVRGVDF